MDQIVEVWHLGDESLIWSAEADQNWIVFTQLGNETPANLLVLANLTGLSAGTYNGTITISSNAKGIKTQTITVTLMIQWGFPKLGLYVGDSVFKGRLKDI